VGGIRPLHRRFQWPAKICSGATPARITAQLRRTGKLRRLAAHSDDQALIAPLRASKFPAWPGHVDHTFDSFRGYDAAKSFCTWKCIGKCAVVAAGGAEDPTREVGAEAIQSRGEEVDGRGTHPRPAVLRAMNLREILRARRDENESAAPQSPALKRGIIARDRTQGRKFGCRNWNPRQPRPGRCT